MPVNAKNASAARVWEVLADHVLNAPANNLHDAAGSPAFNKPLMGFAPETTRFRWSIGYMSVPSIGCPGRLLDMYTPKPR